MTTPQPTWFEHVDLMSVLIGALFMLVAWFMVRTLKTIDLNQQNLFARMHAVETDLAKLQGEHSMCGNCNRSKK